MKYQLEKARTWAEKIVKELDPYCWLIEIAGSIRREVLEVGDIDLVILPKDKAAIKARCIKQAKAVLQDGPQTLVIEYGNGLQLDIFFAKPEEIGLFGTVPTNYGAVLLCRTGSYEFNIKLCEYAQYHGQKFSPCQGLFDKKTGKLLASESERQIFDRIGIPFIDPRDRTPEYLQQFWTI